MFLDDKNQEWFNKALGAIASISSFFTIVEFFAKILTDKENQVALIVFLKRYSTAVSIIVVVGWIVFALFAVLKYRTASIRKMRATSEGLRDIMRLTENQLEEMRKIEATLSEMCNDRREKCALIESLRDKLATTYVQYTKRFLDSLSVILNEHMSRNNGISLCYKALVASGNPKIDCTFTVARSGNSVDVRNYVGKTPVPLKDNSDFNDIVDDNINQSGINYFYVADLKRYQRELEKITDTHYRYVNSDSDWPKYYNATMVVPVGNAGENYKIYGFLCADSLSKRDFTSKQKDINIRMFQGYAQIYSMVAKEYTRIEKMLFAEGGREIS